MGILENAGKAVDESIEKMKVEQKEKEIAEKAQADKEEELRQKDELNE